MQLNHKTIIITGANCGIGETAAVLFASEGANLVFGARREALLSQLAKSLASEHGTDGIRVNTLLPGGTRTAMAGDDREIHDYVSGLHRLGRMADPEAGVCFAPDCVERA